MKNQLLIKRVYDSVAKTDGKRILVDRVWPRGLTKEKAKIDIWLKDIAPSTSLRKWYAHDVSKWDAFKRKYIEELINNQDAINDLKKILSEGRCTLVFGSKDEEHNQAVVLKAFLTSS
ncbi:MAG: DUF488 domain-containing protein [Bacteroidota bacterium]|nr:DUF488 domain-containing protein [Bacteroidota bacterium]